MQNSPKTEEYNRKKVAKYTKAMPQNACFGCWGEAKHIYADLNCCDNCKAALERVECLYNERDLKSFDALRQGSRTA